MPKDIAYRARETRAQQEAREAREEAHWARMYRIATGTLVCAAVTLVCTLSNNENFMGGLRYVSNLQWQATPSTRIANLKSRRHAVDLASAKTDGSQTVVASAVLPRNLTVPASPAVIDSSGLLHPLSVPFTNTSLTASSVTDSSGLLRLPSAGLISPY